PVLFMRSKDGGLFDITPPVVAPRAPEPPFAAPPQQEPGLSERVRAMQALNATFAPERYTMLALIVVSSLVFLLSAWHLVPGTGTAAVQQAGLIPVTGGAGSATLFLVSRLLRINERTLAMVRELTTVGRGA
ncbi:MAG: hypothetical protein ABIZ70_03775, partial [Gemmatimonadales bacterium]